MGRHYIHGRALARVPLRVKGESVIIEIVNATLAEEIGLGPLYRVEQLRDGVPWVHLIARTAVATDMELFGVDNPATVVEWHLHDALTPLAAQPSPADQLAFEAQQLTAAVLTARARLAAGTAGWNTMELAVDLGEAQETANTMRDRAREMKAAEINQLRETVTVADDEGFAELCNLIASDDDSIDTARVAYRARITNRATA
jgi:hypothetical protein